MYKDFQLPVRTLFLLITTSISVAPSLIAALISEFLIFSGISPAGNPVATEAIWILFFPIDDFASFTKFGYTQTAAVETFLETFKSSRISFLTGFNAL